MSDDLSGDMLAPSWPNLVSVYYKNSDTSSAALTCKSQYTKVDTPSVSIAGLPTPPPQLQQRPLSPFPELTPLDSDSIVHELQIDRKKLSLGEILMEGVLVE